MWWRLHLFFDTFHCEYFLFNFRNQATLNCQTSLLTKQRKPACFQFKFKTGKQHIRIPVCLVILCLVYYFSTYKYYIIVSWYACTNFLTILFISLRVPVCSVSVWNQIGCMLNIGKKTCSILKKHSLAWINVIHVNFLFTKIKIAS